jgi:hypothetical protein
MQATLLRLCPKALSEAKEDLAQESAIVDEEDDMMEFTEITVSS